MADLIKEMRNWTRVSIIAQPNADSPLVKESVTVYEQSPDEFTQDTMRIVEASAHVIGGCCGTPPLFIEKARQCLFDQR